MRVPASCVRSVGTHFYGSAKERLRAAREEKPLYKADFSEEELKKLKVLAPEEYKLLI